jgi:hypothetical protein
MRMSCFLLTLALPGSPSGGLLLSNANQDDSVFALASSGLQKRTRHFLLVLSFLEVHHRNVVSLGITVDGLYIGIPDLAKGGRGRDRESSLPTQKSTDLAHRLQFRHIGLQEDAVDGTTPECDPLSQQSEIVRHD